MFLQSWLILYSCHFKSSIQSGSSWTDSLSTELADLVLMSLYINHPFNQDHHERIRYLRSWLILYSCHFKSSIQSGSSWTDSPCTPPGRWLPASSTSPPASPTQAALTWRQADHSYSAPRPGQIRTFFPGPISLLLIPYLFCRIRNFFAGSDLFCRIWILFAESEPFCRIHTFFPNLDLFAGSGPF